MLLAQLEQEYAKTLAVDMAVSYVKIKVENNKPITDPPTVHNCY